MVLLIGISIGLYHYKVINRNGRLFLLYLTLSLALDIAARVIGQTTYNNLITFNVLSLIEVLTFSLYYLNNIKAKPFVLALASIGIGYPLIEIALINTANVASFQSYSKVLVAFLIIIMSFYYIMYQIKREQKIANQNLAFVTIAYFSLELIFLLPLNFLVNYDSPFVLYIWFFRLSVNVFFYTYLIRFIWRNGKVQKQSYSGS